MGAGTILCEAVRAGHPAVIVVGCLILFMAVGYALLRWARRPVPAPSGRPTVDDIRARLDYEVQAEIEQSRVAEFRRLAEQGAAERAKEITAVIPVVEDGPHFPLPAPRRGSHSDPHRRTEAAR